MLLSAGAFLNRTVGEPGVHGVVTGIQGIGVSTPLAAAVAEATVGFANEEHVANGGILLIGIESRIFAAGFFSPVTVGNVTINVDGAEPKLHCNDADITTRLAIINLPLSIVQIINTAYQKTHKCTI